MEVSHRRSTFFGTETACTTLLKLVREIDENLECALIDLRADDDRPWHIFDNNQKHYPIEFIHFAKDHVYIKVTGRTVIKFKNFTKNGTKRGPKYFYNAGSPRQDYLHPAIPSPVGMTLFEIFKEPDDFINAMVAPMSVRREGLDMLLPVDYSGDRVRAYGTLVRQCTVLHALW